MKLENARYTPMTFEPNIWIHASDWLKNKPTKSFVSLEYYKQR